jgi:tRNA (cytidine/uridine-2'-O-)-methyltransferase
VHLVLYQPEIALNLGNIIRIAACFNAKLHIIEPCGFPMDHNRIKRSSMDYYNKIDMLKYKDFSEFYKKNSANKIYLVTTHSSTEYYKEDLDINGYYLFGSESKGVTNEVRDIITNTLKISIRDDCRSLNLANAVAIIAAEICKQNNLINNS